MSVILSAALNYGGLNLSTDVIGYYVNKTSFNNSSPVTFKWLSDNPSITVQNNDFTAINYQGNTNTSMPIRGGFYQNIWLFNGNNKNNFFAPSLTYQTGSFIPFPLTVMLYFEYSSSSVGKKIFGFQNAQPWVTPTNYDRHFYVGNDSGSDRLYYGMYDRQAKLSKTVKSPFVYPDRYYVAVATYSEYQVLTLYLDGVTTPAATATVFDDDKTSVYPVLGGGYLNSTTWPNSITGVNYFTGGIKAMGIWRRLFTQTEVTQLTSFLKATIP
jgi:hypothetical protein